MQFAHDIHAYIAVHKPHLSYYIAIIERQRIEALKPKAQRIKAATGAGQGEAAQVSRPA